MRADTAIHTPPVLLTKHCTVVMATSAIRWETFYRTVFAVESFDAHCTVWSSTISIASFIPVARTPVLRICLVTKHGTIAPKIVSFTRVTHLSCPVTQTSPLTRTLTVIPIRFRCAVS